MNYDRFKNTFTRLLTKYDARSPKIKLKIRQNGSIDPATGLFVAGAETIAYLTGVTANYTDNQIDGEMIKRGDISLIVDSAVAPRVGDYVTMDGLDWTVQTPIITHNPGGVILGYTLQLRR